MLWASVVCALLLPYASAQTFKDPYAEAPAEWDEEMDGVYDPPELDCMEFSAWDQTGETPIERNLQSYEQCEEMGMVDLSELNITQTISWPKLKKVDVFRVGHTTSVKNVLLPNLKFANIVEFWDAHSVEEIDLSSLETVKGPVAIHQAGTIVKLDSLTQARDLFFGNSHVKSVELPSLMLLNESLSVWGNDEIETFSAPELMIIGGFMRFDTNEAMKSIDLSAVTTAKSVGLAHMKKLEEFDMNSLEEVTDFQWNEMYELNPKIKCNWEVPGMCCGPECEDAAEVPETGVWHLIQRQRNKNMTFEERAFPADEYEHPDDALEVDPDQPKKKKRPASYALLPGGGVVHIDKDGNQYDPEAPERGKGKQEVEDKVVHQEL